MKTPAPSLQRIAACALLAWVFLCVQQTANLHWLSHSVEATCTPSQPDASTAADHSARHCDACLAFSAFGSAATGQALSMAASPAPGVTVFAAGVDAAPAAIRLSFRSRAPPSLS